MRPGALAVVAVVCALMGSGAALGIAKATGWFGSGETDTIVLTQAAPAPAVNRVEESGAGKPLAGNDFDPAKIYRQRVAGVVTIVALFGAHTQNGSGDAAQGSGFVVSRSGYILTNSHVVTTAGESSAGDTPEAATSVFIEFRDGDRVPARIVGWDVYDDVGLVKVDPKKHALSPVPLGDSSRVVVGQPVAAIGSPFGRENSLSVGVVSATERSIESLTSSYDLVDAIQTDAPINRGNSGGPMFDARGRVVGINAQIRSVSGNAEGVGFAVPINSAKRSMRQLIENGRVRYAWLGVSTQTLTPQLADHFGFAVDRGAAIQTVVEGSPASKAGLKGGSKEREFTGIAFRPGGDLIVAIDGRRVERAEDVVRAVTERLLPGQTTKLTILRGKQRLVIEVVLGDRPVNPPGSGR
ncbi:MAG TPA: trypsin-like peptidase domain-containing protein [Gaiellaceae bacterium]